MSSKIVRIPTPKFIVFYNGGDEEEVRRKMRLSDSFMKEDKSGDFEWSADVININPKCNKPLQKSCKALYDYIRYVYRIRDNRKSGMDKKAAVEEAMNWAIKERLLDGFFKEQKEEVTAMSLTEYDEEEFKRVCREDGYEDGLAGWCSHLAVLAAMAGICRLWKLWFLGPWRWYSWSPGRSWHEL